MRPNLIRRSLSLTVGLIALAACSDVSAPTSSIETTHLRVSANVSATPIATVVITVTAPDIREPLVFNVTVANGTASGTLDVPPGHARAIAAQGFDVSGNVTHEGSTTMDVVKGTNPPVALTLRPKSGQLSVTITVGSIGVIVSPASFGLVAGGA